jgi:hypothetical protein
MSGFSIPLDKLAEKYKANLETVTRKATFDLFSSVVRKSPVDTGRFRANWNVSQGSPDESTSEATSETRANLQLRKALTFKAGDVVWLCNALPYARRLEYDGWSGQAPQGMVRISVLEFNDFLRKAIQ